MRILADENIPGAAVALLRTSGHDVTWIGEAARGSPDESVLARANTERRVLITCDKDFGRLVLLRGANAVTGVILVRFTTRSPAEFARRPISAIGSRADWEGAFSVLEDQRIRRLPLRAAGEETPPDPASGA